MKTPFLICELVLLLHCPLWSFAQQKEPLTLEAIFSGNLSEAQPSEFLWAPDGRRLAYFQTDGEGNRALWILDLGTGKSDVAVSSSQMQQMAPSPDQASINERERTRRTRYSVSSYVWAPDGNRILFVSAGQLYLHHLASHANVLLAPLKSGLLDPKFSPDGNWVSFIYKHDLWVVPSAGGKEKQLTFGGSNLLLHGEPDWIYQEEFEVKTGYHWSPDSRHIAFLELDEQAVPVYPLIEQITGQSVVDFQRYPKAGDPNPKVRAGVVNLKKRKTVWIDRNAEYLPRIDWADNNAPVVQLLNRDQKELELVEIDPESGHSRSLLMERDSYWLDIGDDLTFLSGGREFLWTSDRSGFRHIYLYKRNGELLRQLTAGDWVVNGIAGVDEKNGWVYYSSNQSEMIGRDLYRVKIDGSKTERLTKSHGTHKISMNPGASAFLDSFSSMARSPETIVHDLASGKEIELFKSRSAGNFYSVEPEARTVTTPDGAIARLLLYKPRTIEPGRKYPLVVYVYGMPGAPAIQDAWAGNRELFHQYLVQQGFVVAQIDDRSSAIPGHRYAVAAYHNLGPVAAKDHETVLDSLKSMPFIDGNAVAIWGWSGGGFTAAYHLTHGKLFKVGIAVAPVTDWRFYDSIYTERYMGLPDREAEAYNRTSAVNAAADYNGRLLLVHGTADDNVHPQNTFDLVRALIRSNKKFDLMLYPDKTHGISGKAESLHLYSTIYEFLERCLREK